MIALLPRALYSPGSASALRHLNLAHQRREPQALQALMLEGPLLCEWREIMRRRLGLGLCAALGAALLLTGAALWPAVTLASARGDASVAVYQATGYGPSNGFGEPSWSG